MEDEKVKNPSLKILLDLFKDIKSIYERNIEFVECGAYDFFPCWIIGTYIFDEFERAVY